MFETDPAKAREIGASSWELYLKLPNYTNNFLWLGFDENDFRGGSDRLIDAIIACGDLNEIRNRTPRASLRRRGPRLRSSAHRRPLRAASPGMA